MREIGEILPAQEKVEARTDLKMGKKSANDHKLNVDKVIKNINTISLELKKIKELSQLLLCDLILHFNHPIKTENLTESKISDISLVSNSFS
uniref:Chromosome 5 open reading frame 58 n=2 Tax=Rhinopithecus TaxID=542827 RepID=A0A2K6M1D9_RHIBE